MAKKPSAQSQRTLKKLPPRVQREIAHLKPHALVKYHDSAGNRLHIEAVKAELLRRRTEMQTPNHEREHHLIRKSRLARQSRTLGAPLVSRTPMSKNPATVRRVAVAKPAAAKKTRVVSVRSHSRRIRAA